MPGEHTADRQHAGVEMRPFGQDIFEAAQTTDGLDAEAYLAARERLRRQTRKDGIDRLLSAHDVEVLVAPSGPLSPRIDPINGDVWPDWVGAGYLAAVAGYPHLTVPMGTVHSVPIGLSFIGPRDGDGRVLAIGHAYEQVSRMRPKPAYLPTVEALPEVPAALDRTGPPGSSR